MRYRISTFRSNGNEIFRVSIRCPHCGHNGTFETISAVDVKDEGTKDIFGMRRCPNNRCNGQLFFVANQRTGELEIVYPAETIPFNADNIPENVLKPFEEAIICHSNSCFIAAAIMIRKTLEEICKDRDSKGVNLYKRLQDLGTKIVLPNELLEGMQELRLLGNDAAHVEANTFNDIGRDEIEISIEFTQEILKGVYQYESLLKRIRSLKKVEETGE